MIIEINLLPHREAKRVAELRQTLAFLILGFVLAVSLVVGSLALRGIGQRMGRGEAASRESIVGVLAVLETLESSSSTMLERHAAVLAGVMEANDKPTPAGEDRRDRARGMA